MTSNNQISVDDTSRHVVCFVALPFKDSVSFAYQTVLLPALRTVLEQPPYYWQVGRADDNYFKDTIYENVAYWMGKAHAYIADISDLNPNVLLELGYMYWARSHGQPLIILESFEAHQKHVDTRLDPVDLAGVIRIFYHLQRGNHAIEDVAQELKVEFDKRQDIQKLNTGNRYHYLSPLILSNKLQLSNQLAELLASKYLTMEALVNADVTDIRRRIPALNVDMARMIHKSIMELLRNP
jgi:hypothetical protein